MSRPDGDAFDEAASVEAQALASCEHCDDEGEGTGKGTGTDPKLRALAERWGTLSEDIRDALLRVAGIDPQALESMGTDIDET